MAAQVRCLRILGEFAEGRKLKLQPKDCFFINLFRKFLQCNVPREVSALGDDNVIIFIDACYERDSLEWPCGLGEVLCDGDVRLYFSLEVGSHEPGKCWVNLLRTRSSLKQKHFRQWLPLFFGKRRFLNKQTLCIICG